jgi:hypothetical protein
MEWMANPDVGAWLREHLDASATTMHVAVPHGYPAYARVFHPAVVRTLPDRPVPTHDEWDRMPDAERQRLTGQFVAAPATWAETAEAFGTTMHPFAQWQRIVRTPADEGWQTRVAPDGREFHAPIEGDLDAGALAALARHLVAHTETPDAGYAALWDGWGGLLGFFGGTPSRAALAFDGDPHHQEMLNRSTHDPFNNVFRKPTWQDGILSREISEGPRLELPDRKHVLFSAPPRAFADPEWVLQAPWRDPSSGSGTQGADPGFPVPTQSPNILWPEDRAWVLVSEVDFDSTIVAGSDELIGEICADDRLEALQIPEGTDLTWDADQVNR